MTYHTIMPTIRQMVSEHKAAWLFLAIFTYGCLVAALTASIVKPDFPVFDCQEDEIAEWKDARRTAECVNIEEFVQEELTGG